MPSHPHVYPSNSVSSAGLSTKVILSGAGSMSSSTSSPLLLKKEMSSAWLEALKMQSSIGSPGADGWEVELWISGGGGCWNK